MNKLGAVWAALALVIASSPAVAQTPAEAAQDAFRDDVHAGAGLTCGACHRQRPPVVAPIAPIGPIARTAVAPLCGTCHSDAAYMKRFDPQVRVDQYSQYLTSTHGKQMATGETRVATCTDCHGAHGIRKVSDLRSPVARVNVARTCARCHADPARMSAFGLAPTPFTDWSGSVHADALLKRGDVSAPTCSTCHGSHGATPPGVTEVANVCAQCHVREAELFRASPKKAIFDQMGQAECLACHNNHRIERPVDAWVGLKDPAVCATCHDSATKGADTIVTTRTDLDALTASIDGGETVLGNAERAGMLVDDGRAALREAREHQIQARVLVHTFAPQPFQDMAGQGGRAARDAQAVGERALHELQVRRRGLLGATIVILGFLVTLWLKIRRITEERSS
jgi:predicted CXXCH cytochrome family protein